MAWNWPWTRPGRMAAAERKDATPGFVALHLQGEAAWSRRDYGSLARQGFMRNPVAHRSIRLGVACGLVFGGTVGLKIATELGVAGALSAAELMLMGSAAASLFAWWAIGFLLRAIGSRTG